MKLDKYQYGFIGFGHMGEILCTTLLKSHAVPKSNIFFTRKDPKKSVRTEKKHHITGMKLETLLEKCDVIFLCVQPKHIDKLIDSFPLIDRSKKLFISVIAGNELSYFQKKLKTDQVIRVMPNVPSQIGEGMNILCYDKSLSSEFLDLTESLLGVFGKWMHLDEKLMNTATAISGCGPGFVYQLIHAMGQVGKEGGIDYQKAIRLAAQTFVGAAKLISQGQDPEKLIQDISVPGGVTSAGFEAMDELEVQKRFKRSIKRSIERANELTE